MRQRERDRASDLRGHGQTRRVRDRRAPIVPDQIDLRSGVIDQRDDVGNQRVEIERPVDRRRCIATQERREHAVRTRQVLEEGQRGGWMIRKAVQPDQRRRRSRPQLDHLEHTTPSKLD